MKHRYLNNRYDDNTTALSTMTVLRSLAIDRIVLCFKERVSRIVREVDAPGSQVMGRFRRDMRVGLSRGVPPLAEWQLEIDLQQSLNSNKDN